MFNDYSYEVTNLFKEAENEKNDLKHSYVGTEHLLLAILKDSDITSFLEEYNLTYNNFKKELSIIRGEEDNYNKYNLYTPMLKKVINNATLIASEEKRTVNSKDLLKELIECGDGIAIRILIGMNIDIDSLYDDLTKNKSITKKDLEIYNIGNNLNDLVKMEEVVIGRNKEIDLMIETLLRCKKNNPLLLGDAGVGKTAIVEELARRINRKEVPEELFNKRIISLEMGSLVSGTKYRGEFEEKLTKIIKELENNHDIILFIDEIHSMVNAGGAEGAITAGDILKPALARGDIKCIGATTKEEYNKYFGKDKALMRRFEVINICEPSNNETKSILLQTKSIYEKHHKVIINDNIIDKLIYYVNNFIKDKKNPDKSLDFLDSLCSYVKRSNYKLKKKNTIYQKLEILKHDKELAVKNNDYKKALDIYNEENNYLKEINNLNNNDIDIINEEDIINLVNLKTNRITLNDLDNISKSINNKLFNVDTISNKLINIFEYYINNNKSITSILLEGNKYLGKTEIVNIIKDNLSNIEFINIDLKDYQNKYDMYKLIGINDEPYIFSKLKSNIFSIILFDNYELSNKDMKDLINNILTNKYILDSKGDKIYFYNSIIFITNNIIKNNKVGFDNNIINHNDIDNLIDYKILFNNLDKHSLINYLNKLNIDNKDYIINNSNYIKENYKNINKLIKESKIIQI